MTLLHKGQRFGKNQSSSIRFSSYLFIIIFIYKRIAYLCRLYYAVKQPFRCISVHCAAVVTSASVRSRNIIGIGKAVYGRSVQLYNRGSVLFAHSRLFLGLCFYGRFSPAGTVSDGEDGRISKSSCVRCSPLCCTSGKSSAGVCVVSTVCLYIFAA